MSQSPSYASPTPPPSLQSSKLTISLNAARRNNAPAESTPSPLRTPPVLTPTARKQALREFYNLDRSRPISTSTDLDRDPFNGKDFVDKLVRENGLHALVRMENDLVQEIRNLDGERKSLVYDNYNKLIAATETIRKMRAHLDPVDPNQSPLGPSIQRISELSLKLEPAETKLDEKQRLAKQVRWAMECPERIRQLCKDGEKEKAQEMFEKLKVLVDGWDNVKDKQELIQQCKTALAFGE